MDPMNPLSPDSTFGRMFNLLMELIILNFLWLVTSLPLVTLGASTAALYDSVQRLLKSEDSHMIRPFFKSFCRYFLRGTGLLALAVIAGGLIYFDFWAACQWDSPLALVCLVVIAASLYFFLMTLVMAFPILVCTGGKLFATVKLAFFTGLQGKFRTILVVLVNMIPVLLWVGLPDLFVQTSGLWMVLGIAAIAYFTCGQMMRLLGQTPEADA